MSNLEQKQLLAAAMRRKDILERAKRFDGVVGGSKPTVAQQSVLSDLGKIPVRFVKAGNQGGKTQTAVRECAWVFEESHPTWKRHGSDECPNCGSTTVTPSLDGDGNEIPGEYKCENGHRWKDWGNEPLQLLVLCNTLKQFEDVIWRKLRELLDPGSYKIKRSSAGFEKIINTRNGNEILILSYHNTGDAADKIQGFVGHWAWIDEMPYSYKIFEETIRRVASRGGSFIATFTPKVRNDAIRRFVDSAQAPAAKVYKFKMFDNPVYASPEKQAEELQKLAGLPESVRKTILEGDWTAGELAVYYFNYEEMAKVPQGYSTSWRHVAAVDPATESKLGLVMLAEDPRDGTWYIVRTEYLEGIYVPELIVEAVEKIFAGYHIVQRVCDTNASWYIRQASHMGYSYGGIYNKKERKMELIKGLQGFLGRKGFVAPWCDGFIDEVTGASWSETAEGKIVGGQKYHLLDAVQYAIDRLPKFVANLTITNWADKLIQADDARLKMEAQKKGFISHGGRIQRGIRGGRRRCS